MAKKHHKENAAINWIFVLDTARPNCVMSFIQNILFFTTSWSAKAVQNCSIRFCEGRITISCNSCLVRAYFSCAILDHFINSFGITIKKGFNVKYLQKIFSRHFYRSPLFWAVFLISSSMPSHLMSGTTVWITWRPLPVY